jgi:hypothetical protein
MMCRWINQEGDFPMTINVNHYTHRSKLKSKNKIFKNRSLTAVFKKTVFLTFLLAYLLTKKIIYIYIYTDSAGENVIFSKFFQRKCHFRVQLEAP